MDSESQDQLRARRRDQFRKKAYDGQALKELLEAGLTWLRTNQQLVNSLNVFPVPDGDTGVNMVLTMQSAYNEIKDSPERNIGIMAHSVAHGALMGARGNSGVILSQLWRGFARGLDKLELLDAPAFVHSLALARDTAYKGVVKPVEGTILTVAKDTAAAAERALQETDDPIEILEKCVAAADASVAHTPELLAELKRAGVVDAGGKGFFFILEGMLRHIDGLSLNESLMTVKPLAALALEETMESIEPGQDYEIVVDFRPHQPLVLERFYNDLMEMGTSIQVGEGDGMYRMHIHVPTEKRYEPIDYTMSIGTITKVHIENLMAQMEEVERSAAGSKLNLATIEPGQIAVVAVAPGTGIARVFASLGVAAVVAGGQTMNPSTQEIIGAFENLPTDKIIILPNNSNIILTAQAAAGLTVKKVAVIPTRTTPQGLTAMLRLDADEDFETVVEEMNRAVQEVQTAELTTATRSVELDGITVKEGQIIGLHNDKLVTSAETLEEACLDLLEKCGTEDLELLTFFYGNNIDKNTVNKIVDKVREVYPNHEIEVKEGGQPHYFFIIGVE